MQRKPTRNILIGYSSDLSRACPDLEALAPIKVQWFDDLVEVQDELSKIEPISVIVFANTDNIGAMQACSAIRKVCAAPIHLISRTLSPAEAQLAKAVGAATVLHPAMASGAIILHTWTQMSLSLGPPPIASALDASTATITNNGAASGRNPGSTSDEGSTARACSTNGIEIDMDRRVLRIEGRLIKLTKIEFDLLTELVKRPGLVVKRRAIIDAVWGAGWFGAANVLDTHLAHLRSKMGEAGYGHAIVNVRGVGFYFEPSIAFELRNRAYDAVQGLTAGLQQFAAGQQGSRAEAAL